MKKENPNSGKHLSLNQSRGCKVDFTKQLFQIQNKSFFFLVENKKYIKNMKFHKFYEIYIHSVKT